MKKNLIYYCLGINPKYSEILKISLKSLDSSNPNLFDVLIITDEEYYNSYLKNIERENLHYFIVPKFQNKDEVVFSKLKVFEWKNIVEYENIFLSDCDVLVNTNLQKLFDNCKDKNKIYAPVEDFSFDNHRRIYFSLGNYTENDIEFFKLNKIHTFNSGTIMFKVSEEMKLHFQNIRRIISGYKGDYFTEQSFLNYYFNKMNIVNNDLLDCQNNLTYIINSNFYTQKNYENKIFHLIGNTFDGDDKERKMVEFYDLMVSKKIIKNETLITFLNVSEDRKKVFFSTNEDISCHLNVWEGAKLVFAKRMNMGVGWMYWVDLDDGYKNKIFEFMNEDFYQKEPVFGREEFIKKKIINYVPNFKYSELSLLWEKNNPQEFENRKDFLDYYYEIFRFSEFKKNKIIEFDVNSETSIRDWRKILPNSKVIGTTSLFDNIRNNDEFQIYYCDLENMTMLEHFFENKNLDDLFDLIIIKNIEKFKDHEKLHYLTKKLELGGNLIIENINIDDLDNVMKLLDFEKLESNLIALSDNFDLKTKLIAKIQRTQ